MTVDEEQAPSNGRVCRKNVEVEIQVISEDKQKREDQADRIVTDPIIYHYLTFESVLPQPPASSAREVELSPLPAPPDLTGYVSPFTWPEARKRTIILLSCICSTVVCYAAGSYDAGLEPIMAQWGVSHTVATLGITTFTIGFGIAPMILAPFSELNGRKPVFIVTGVIFCIAQLSCALTTSFSGLLVARLFVGVGGSTFSSTIGGVISDIYYKKNRNAPMALFSGSALFGTGLGPLVSGFVAQRVGWRWVFWVQVITCGLSISAVIAFFNETRGSVILSRKARLLNKWYEAREQSGLVGDFQMPLNEHGSEYGSQRIRWKVKSDEERETLAKMLGISLYRPFHLLCTEPVVFFFSLWAAFSWAVLYLTFSIVPLVFTTNHGFNLEQNGAVFAAMCVGSLLSTVISLFQERIAGHYGKMSSTPEGRLYFSCVQCALLPIGLFWFAWTLAPSVHWVVPTLAIGCATMGLFSIYLAVFNYLADTYHRYASSALAAQSFCRNMLAGTFPLLGGPMFARLTFQGASSFLGGVSLLLTIVPWVLVFYGPKIRARSKFASENMHQ
ncbi:Cycloheximide resistance protein [Colletotrichum chlorophyti]|uniref:Cycloheximide resistance protein n=1 Tax=Colletotrichum chlorophyti TaxID=708187 RepID=A0A1Q8S257_9PEZI|nr:Cycloheximide resistance protein [Colletotrichum chlorophyti]